MPGQLEELLSQLRKVEGSCTKVKRSSDRTSLKKMRSLSFVYYCPPWSYLKIDEQ